MIGGRRRLFTMNIEGLAVVCLFNACLDGIARATGVKLRIQLGAV